MRPHIICPKRRNCKTARNTDYRRSARPEFPHVAFEISFEKTKHRKRNRCCEFLIYKPGRSDPSAGESCFGGELSRIMLAIKTILADRDETETLIFDEIDTGISGRTAQKVSENGADRAAPSGHPSPICRRSRRWQILILKSKNVEENGDRHIDPSLSRKILSENWQECRRREITDSVLANASEMKRGIGTGTKICKTQIKRSPHTKREITKQSVVSSFCGRRVKVRACTRT